MHRGEPVLVKGAAPPPRDYEGFHSGTRERWRNVQPTLVAQIQLCHNFIIAVSQSFILFTSETLSSLKDRWQVKGAFVVCTWNNLGGDWSLSYISPKPLNIHFWGHCDVAWAETSIQLGVEALFKTTVKVHEEFILNCFVCAVLFLSFVSLFFKFLF